MRKRILYVHGKAIYQITEKIRSEWSIKIEPISEHFLEVLKKFDPFLLILDSTFSCDFVSSLMKAFPKVLVLLIIEDNEVASSYDKIDFADHVMRFEADEFEFQAKVMTLYSRAIDREELQKQKANLAEKYADLLEQNYDLKVETKRLLQEYISLGGDPRNLAEKAKALIQKQK